MSDGQTAAALEAARKFVQSAVSGERLAANSCLGRDTIRCGSLALVSSASVDSAVRVRGDTALVTVRYVELGVLAPASGGLRFVVGDSARQLVIDTVRLVRERGAWRPVDSPAPTRVLAKIGMYYFDLVDGARDQVARSAGLGFSSAVRLVLTDPAELGQLPPFVRDSLVARRCRVLQRRGHPNENVLRGAFLDPGDGDWAALCVRSTEGTILVFSRQGGRPAELPNIGGPIPDVNALPRPEDPFIYGCAPGIDVAPRLDLKSASSVESMRDDDTGPDTLSRSERQVPAHDGINSADCEGTSNIYFWTGRRWIRLPGAD